MTTQERDDAAREIVHSIDPMRGHALATYRVEDWTEVMAMVRAFLMQRLRKEQAQRVTA